MNDYDQFNQWNKLLSEANYFISKKDAIYASVE